MIYEYKYELEYPKRKDHHFTGQFELRPQYRAEHFGATIVESISEDVDWLVLGTGHSSTILEQAQNLGIEVLDEKRFFEFVNLQDVWEEHEKAKAAKQRDMKPEAEMETLETDLGRPLTDEARLDIAYGQVFRRKLARFGNTGRGPGATPEPPGYSLASRRQVGGWGRDKASNPPKRVFEKARAHGPEMEDQPSDTTSARR